jgi:AP-2 complex subunit alpha
VDIRDCAKRFLVADNGLLYEDANLQIGVKSQWQGSQGRVMFYIGNKSADADLQNFRMVIPPIEGLRHSLQPVPASIGAKRQVQLMLQVAITSAFASVPKLEFSYTSTTVTEVCTKSLDLPVRVTKFLSPMSIASPQEFIAKWHQMASAGQQQKIMDVSQQYATSIERVSNAFAGMRLVVHKGLDPNPANLVAGSRFVGERSGEVFVGVRVESDANVRGRYRFTVASMNAVAVAAIMDTIVTALQ